MAHGVEKQGPLHSLCPHTLTSIHFSQQTAMAEGLHPRHASYPPMGTHCPGPSETRQYIYILYICMYACIEKEILDVMCTQRDTLETIVVIHTRLHQKHCYMKLMYDGVNHMTLS